jgi:putative acetyltransferase
VSVENEERAARYRIRPIEVRDRAAVAALIRTVMPEFGAKGPGFAILDPEVDDMFGAYAGPRAGYFVVERDDGVVCGGGGFAQLASGDADTCELRKMYFLAELRGLGIGQKLLELCIAGARDARYERMYLETLENMTKARALYERNGFRRLDRAMGATGHFGCNSFYALDLR